MSYHVNFKPSVAQSNSLARSVRYNDNKLLVSIIKFVEYLSLNLAENVKVTHAKKSSFHQKTMFLINAILILQEICISTLLSRGCNVLTSFETVPNLEKN